MSGLSHPVDVPTMTAGSCLYGADMDAVEETVQVLFHRLESSNLVGIHGKVGTDDIGYVKGFTSTGWRYALQTANRLRCP